MSWFERWSRRQDELAQGVDADLVRENRKQYIRAFWLLGFGFLLAFLMLPEGKAVCDFDHLRDLLGPPTRLHF